MTKNQQHIELLALAMGITFCSTLVAGWTLDGDTMPNLCLVLQPSNSVDRIEGAVTNRCGKRITAFATGAEIWYSNGTKQSVDGAVDEFLPTLMNFSEGDLGLGRGLLRDGETRTLHPRSLPAAREGDGVPVRVVPRVSCVVFEDGSSTGDPLMLERIFIERKLTAEEASYWETKLRGDRGILLSSASLVEYFRSPEVERRARTAPPTTPGYVIKSYFSQLLRLAEYFDRNEQTIARPKAVEQLLGQVRKAKDAAGTHSKRKGEVGR